jgi:chromosome segregation ATPase
MATNTALRKERADATKEKEGALLAQKLEHDKLLSDLRENHDIAMTDSRAEYEIVLKELHASLNAKHSTILSLEEEVSSLMEKMMALAGDLQKLQDKSGKERASHTDIVSSMKNEMNLLRGQISSKDSELAVLLTKNSSLETENSDLNQKLEKLLIRCAELEEENAFIMDLENQLLEINYEVVETEEEQIMAAEEHKIAIENLRDEYESERVMWASMEKGLVERMSHLEKERREIADELKRSRDTANSSVEDLEGRLSRADNLAISMNSTIEILRRSLDEKDERVAALSASLKENRCQSKERDEAMSALYCEIDDLRVKSAARTLAAEETIAGKNAQIENLEVEISKERAQIIEQDAKCFSLQAELCAIRDRAERDLADISAVVDEKETASRLLLTELESAKKLLQKQELRIQELQSEISMLRQDHERVRNDDSSLVAEKESLIVELGFELQQAKTLCTKKEQAHHVAIVSKDRAIQSLEISLAEVQSTVAHLKLSNQAVLREKYSLSEDLEGERKKSIETESSLKQVEATLFQLRQGAQSSALQLSTTITEKEQQIFSLTRELEKAKAEITREEHSRRVAVVAKDQSILFLQASLDEQQISMEQLKVSQQLAQTEKDIRLSSMEEAIETLRAKKAKDDEEKLKMLQDKENQIVSLRNDLKASGHVSLEQSEAHRKELHALTSKLQRATTDLAIAEDEIRDLKFIDLKEAEETISSLENEVATLRKKTNVVSKNAADATSDLECQITQLRTKTLSLERCLIDSNHMHDKIVEKMQSEQASLKEDNVRLTTELQDRFDKLQERHADIASLVSKTSQLEANERKLLAEIEILRTSEVKIKGDYETVVLALEREFQNQHMSREDYDLERQKQQAALRNEVANAEAKIVSQQEQMAKLEGVIGDRSRLLSDMVSHNKETEDAYDKARAKLSDLELVADRYRVEKEDAKAEIDRLVVLLQRKEDQFLDTLQDERQRREIAEADLEKVLASARLAKNDNKEMEELEKENTVLRDKVRRQEAYLKRKLEKDKVLRDRTVPSDSIFKERAITTTKNVMPTNVMATPSRSRIPTKITTPARPKIPSPSSKRGSAVTTSRIVPPSSSRSITTAQSDTSSFPDEWDLNSLY